MYYGSDVEIRSYITHIGNSIFTIGHEAGRTERAQGRGRAVLVHYDFIEQKKTEASRDKGLSWRNTLVRGMKGWIYGFHRGYNRRIF